MADDTTSPTNASNLPTPPSASDQELKPFSCILCKQRKIKCDKHYPCQNCSKAKSQCIFRAPAPPRRGKRKPAEVNLLARLKRYEDMLQGLGVAIEKLKIDEDAEAKQEKPPEWRNTGGVLKMGVEKLNDSGKLIADDGKGKSIYVEDNLWTKLSEELKDPGDIVGESDEEEDDEPSIERPTYELNSNDNQLIYTLGMYVPSVRVAHPPVDQVRQLWEIYKLNFNPITKTVHVPSLEPLIFAALRSSQPIPKNLEALMYSIYCGALTSLDSDETQARFGEDQLTMLSRYKMAAQQALVRAGLLKSADVMVIQAHTIFLLANRQSIDPRTLWVLTGVNMRLSHRVGLHRDGTHLGLTPFDTEMRRRLWWQVLVLDTHSAILSGSGGVIFHHAWDTKSPMNINDADIWPTMKAPPLEREGPTEMFFCLLRQEFGKFFRMAKLQQGSYQSVMLLSAEDKNRQINEVEKNIEQKFLRFCDPLNPLHHLAQGAGRAAVASMRLIANQPRSTPGKPGQEQLTEQQRTNLFLHSLKSMEYDSMSYSDPRVRGYRWHVRAYFQYNAFVVLLSELCHRGAGEDVERAWDQVSQVFRNHPELKGQRSLQVALGKLVCKAWMVRAAAMIQAGEQPLPPPGVAELLAFRAQAERNNQHAGGAGAGGRHGSASASVSSGPSPAALERLLPEQVWGQWVQQGQQGQQYQQSSTASSGSDAPTPPGAAGSSGTNATSPSATSASSIVGAAAGSGAAWVGGSWMGTQNGAVAVEDGGFDFNALQQEPTPMDWAAWDEIFRESEKGGGMPFMNMDYTGGGGGGSGGGGAPGGDAAPSMGAASTGGFGGPLMYGMRPGGYPRDG